MRSALLALIVLSLACGDDSAAFDGGPDAGARVDVSTFDAGPDDSGSDVGEDGGPSLDAGPTSDAGPGLDAAALDVGTDVGTDVGRDAGTDAGRDAGADAGRDAGTDAGRPDGGGACHGYTFGGPAIDFERVATLPTMTGGEIPRGIYDAIQVRTTLATTGTYRGTWVFEDDTTLQSIEQITLSGAPPPLTPRTQTYRTVGTSIQRRRTCAGTAEFDNQFQVRRADGRVFLDIRASTLVFTYQRRD